MAANLSLTLIKDTECEPCFLEQPQEFFWKVILKDFEEGVEKGEEELQGLAQLSPELCAAVGSRVAAANIRESDPAEKNMPSPLKL